MCTDFCEFYFAYYHIILLTFYMRRKLGAKTLIYSLGYKNKILCIFMYKNSLKNKNMPRTTHQSKLGSVRVLSINDKF